MTIRVALADDQHLIRGGFSSRLQNTSETIGRR